MILRCLHIFIKEYHKQKHSHHSIDLSDFIHEICNENVAAGEVFPVNHHGKAQKTEE